METGIIDLSLVAVRKAPDDKSEMINQLLFGDLIYVLETSEKWSKIKSEWDNYEGWIDSGQWLAIEEKEFLNVKNTMPILCPDLTLRIHSDNEEKIIVLGSSMPNLIDCKISFNNKYYIIDNQLNTEFTSINNLSIYKKYMGAPYLWGGRSVFGIDCSGFTQMVFKFQGTRLKRDTGQQAEQGIAITSLSEAKKGDLIFFKNNKQKITHTGIYLGENSIVHASGKVRVDTIDETGIYRESEKKYTHSFHSIKRIEGSGL